MKNGLFLFIGLCLIWLACKYNQGEFEDQNDQIDLSELRSSDPNFTPFNIPFPEGTTFEIIGSDVKFTVPKPYYLAGVDVNGNFHASEPGGTGTVTCECTSKDSKGNTETGCDPVKNGNDVGCLLKGDCDVCRKSVTSKIVGVNEDILDLVILHPDNDLKITSFEEIHHKYLLPRSFLNYPEFRDLLTAIHNDQLNLPDMPKKTVFVNIHGYILPIELKVNDDNGSISAIGGEAEVKCSCNVRDKQGNPLDCPKDSKWGVVWCNSSNCSNCTMSIGRIIDSTGTVKSMSAEGGKIIVQ